MKELENEIMTCLEEFLTTQYGDGYEYSFSNYGSIEICAIDKNDSASKCLLIRAGINDYNEQVYISNIFIPQDLQYNGIGKKMILIIYEICQKYNYDVCVVQLTDGFKERLLKRGAVRTNEYDTLLIVSTTNLL